MRTADFLKKIAPNRVIIKPQTVQIAYIQIIRQIIEWSSFKRTFQPIEWPPSLNKVTKAKALKVHLINHKIQTVYTAKDI